VRTLIVQHVPKSKRPAFTVIRCDPSGTTPDVAKITPPEEFGTKELPGSHLRRELRWYLEQFLDYPFPPNTDRADRVTQVLEAWGTHAFSALFLAGKGRDWYHDAVRDGTEHLQLRIIANEPTVLAWPWEALYDPERGFLAHKCHIERHLNNVADPPPLPDNLPRDRLNILLVTARPFEGDVEYRSISRALVEQIEANQLAASVTVLRPPTFDALREELGRRPGYYHIVHFDGHGGYGVIADNAAQAGTLADTVNPHAFQGPQGCLVFETGDGKPDPIPAETLSATLHEFRIPMVVLNACQSATIDENAENAFASVAASLVRAGIRSVVAMAWSLYVSGAQQFLPAFYRRLLETGSLAEPTRAGRAAMLTHPGRVCARGTYPLQDWLVPVVYQQQPADLSFVTQAKPKEDEQTTAVLPEEATDKENPYGFIGRDSAILALERALLRDPPAILIHGLGGVGKTTLARGFLQWLRQTEGLGAGCLWFTFNDIHTAEYVLNGVGTAISDSRFITLDTEQKLTALGQILRENRLILIWDNFESASGNEAAGIHPLLRPDDLQLLRRFLQALQGGRSKVLITSRSEEAWLPVPLRYKLPLGGLTGESRWEFCTAILRNLGIQTNREDPDLAGLMDTLDGHPLLMRAVLPRLEGGRSAQSILQELQGNLAADGTGADPTQKKVYSTLRFVEDGLPKDLRPALVPLGLHDRFVDARLLELMAKGATQRQVTRTQIDRLLCALATAGLVRNCAANTIYELHPALTGFLRATVLTQGASAELESWQRAFVDVMGSLADALAPKQLHEQRPYFHTHSANFHAALSLADTLGMDTHFGALTQSLAAYAQNTLNFDTAERLFQNLAESRHAKGDNKVEAGAYHQLGRIAQQRRNFETAERWYRMSLEIIEKLSDERAAAMTYHQLGRIAEERRDFETAKKWYDKSLEITETLSDERAAAMTYHQLGRIAEEQRDFETAKKWYFRSLQISEKLGIEHYAASTHAQLGVIALLMGDFAEAEAECQKAVSYFEQTGDQANASVDYHQLGVIAERRRDFETAETWYLKSLQISEKLGIEHYAASTYGQLGLMAHSRERFVESGKWFIKSILAFQRCHDPHSAGKTARNFADVLDAAPQADRTRMLRLCQEAGLGDLPKI
jgi:tetratricopeptide (TPR) repeat protein